MRPHPPSLKQNVHGFSTMELLLVVAMVSVLSGFLIVSLVNGRRTESRTNSAVEFANLLQKARVDSMRRSARDIEKMAQVKVFNRKFYSVALDADGDGQLDIPLVMSFPPEEDVEINGPFPKTYIFDWQGQTVDAENRRIAPQPITVSNSSGASAIKFTETGKVVVVVPAMKPVSAK